MRKPYIAGNWKMNNTIAEAKALAGAILKGITSSFDADVAVIPPFLAIPAISELLRGSIVKLGAQDVYFEKNGAFTGEISVSMLADAGCSFALVGHSERRHVLKESDDLIKQKLEALLKSNMEAILCVGETIEERESGKTETRLKTQITSAMKGLGKSELHLVTVAYEPVWAIGTGKTATTKQAQEAHAFIRGLVAELFDSDAANSLRIQYGGSVKPENAASLLSEPDVDGALVGGASLKAESFLGIIAGA